MIAILSCRTGGPTTASYARRISASDRIQQLLSNGRHAQTPPIPLVPYAVGLSLTVAYRCLRDNANVDPERAKADLATRCETLEMLSTYWWTADAMARLGRKALGSLQQPGVRKLSIANLANAMDAEVAVCKFGPFDRRGGSGSTIRPSRNAKDGNATGNALHVLSDAAATHSTHPSGVGVSLASDLHGQITPTPGTFSTPTTTTTQPRLTHDDSRTNTNTTSLPPTPQLGAAFTSTAETQPQPQTTSPGLDVVSGSAFEQGQYEYQFNDLDNLFDGFFDLSMPTIFQDPLFDGDAFLNANLDFGDGTLDPVGAGAGVMEIGMGMGMGLGGGVGAFDAGNSGGGLPTNGGEVSDGS